MTDKTQFNISIPSEKLNDFKFIYDTLIDAKLSILKTISNQTKNPMEQLVNEFMPELKDYDRIDLLEKYGLKANIVALPSEPVDLNPHLDMEEKYNTPKPVEEPKAKKVINRKPQPKVDSTPGYKVFSEKQREVVIKNNPNVSINEIPVLVDTAWKALTKKEKDEYENRAKHSSLTLSTLPVAKAPVGINIPTPKVPEVTVVLAPKVAAAPVKKVIIVKKNLPVIPTVKEPIAVVQEPVSTVLSQVEEQVKTVVNNLEVQSEQIAKVSEAVSNASTALDKANKVIKKIVIVKKPVVPKEPAAN